MLEARSAKQYISTIVDLQVFKIFGNAFVQPGRQLVRLKVCSKQEMDVLVKERVEFSGSGFGERQGYIIRVVARLEIAGDVVVRRAVTAFWFVRAVRRCIFENHDDRSRSFRVQFQRGKDLAEYLTELLEPDCAGTHVGFTGVADEIEIV